MITCILVNLESYGDALALLTNSIKFQVEFFGF